MFDHVTISDLSSTFIRANPVRSSAGTPHPNYLTFHIVLREWVGVQYQNYIATVRPRLEYVDHYVAGPAWLLPQKRFSVYSAVYDSPRNFPTHVSKPPLNALSVIEFRRILPEVRPFDSTSKVALALPPVDAPSIIQTVCEYGPRWFAAKL